MIRCTRFQSGDISMKMIQGLIDVHPSFQNSTLESFVSHGSGAPGLSIVVDKYHDMVATISLRKHDLSSAGGNLCLWLILSTAKTSSLETFQVDYIFNKTSWEPGFDNRPARLYLSQTILKVSRIPIFHTLNQPWTT